MHNVDFYKELKLACAKRGVYEWLSWEKNSQALDRLPMDTAEYILIASPQTVGRLIDALEGCMRERVPAYEEN